RGAVRPPLLHQQRQRPDPRPVRMRGPFGLAPHGDRNPASRGDRLFDLERRQPGDPLAQLGGRRRDPERRAQPLPMVRIVRVRPHEPVPRGEEPRQRRPRRHRLPADPEVPLTRVRRSHPRRHRLRIPDRPRGKSHGPRRQRPHRKHPPPPPPPPPPTPTPHPPKPAGTREPPNRGHPRQPPEPWAPEATVGRPTRTNPRNPGHPRQPPEPWAPEATSERQTTPQPPNPEH